MLSWLRKVDSAKPRPGVDSQKLTRALAVFARQNKTPPRRGFYLLLRQSLANLREGIAVVVLVSVYFLQRSDKSLNGSTRPPLPHPIPRIAVAATLRATCLLLEVIVRIGPKVTSCSAQYTFTLVPDRTSSGSSYVYLLPSTSSARRRNLSCVQGSLLGVVCVMPVSYWGGLITPARVLLQQLLEPLQRSC